MTRAKFVTKFVSDRVKAWLKTNNPERRSIGADAYRGLLSPRPSDGHLSTWTAMANEEAERRIDSGILFDDEHVESEHGEEHAQ